jgi:hypothetical protein
MNEGFHTPLANNYTTILSITAQHQSAVVWGSHSRVSDVSGHCGVTLCTWVMLLDVSEDRAEGSGVQEQFLLGLLQ